jgi:hypothetical protein
MPTLQRIFTLEITPEKFVDNCSEVELEEVILLANKRLSYYDVIRVAEESKVNGKSGEWRVESGELAEAGAQSIIKQINSSTVQQKGGVEGLPKSAKGKSGGWTEREDGMLRELWPDMAVLDIAFKMKRGYNSVMGRAYRLGLSKQKSNKEGKYSKGFKERATDCIGRETKAYDII